MTMTGLFADLARDQHGLVARRQLLRLGLSSSAVFRRIRRGLLLPIRDGVYALPGVPPTWAQRAMAAVLEAGPPCALSLHAAGYLHGLDGLADVAPREFDLLVPHSRRLALEGVTVHRTRLPLTLSWRQRLPVTQLAPTLIDLASTLPSEALELALDSAHRAVRDIGPWIRRVLAATGTRGREGTAVLEALLDARLGTPNDSPLESRVLSALRRAKLPEAKLQFDVSDERGHVLRVDFAWPAQRVALHADSELWHGDRVRRARDADQRRRLTVLGWKQLVVTASDLHRPHWLDHLRRTLEPQLYLRW